MKFKQFLAIAACVMLLSCGGNNKADAQAAGATEQTTTTDDAAERVAADGSISYRPDTARIFHASGWDDGSAFIVISKRELRLKVYGTINGDTTLLAQYPVCLSRNKGQKGRSGDMRTPESEPGKPFYIKQIQDASNWKHDFGDGRGEILSYGPWFMRLATPFNGIGIHGSTNNENKMPGRDSEGCIRLRDNDVDHLKRTFAYVGMPVIIKTENQGPLPFER